jgi:hypothetical protein
MQRSGGIARAVAAIALGSIAVLHASSKLPAQEAEKDAPAAAVVETEEEKLERDGRRKCAASVCATLHEKRPAEGLASCSIRKTWRKEALTKLLSKAKVSWPWGDTRCASEVRFDRATLVKAMEGPQYEAQFEAHDVRCTIDGEKEKYEITIQLRPKVTFKDGKAIKASLNWGKLEAPTLAKSALWSITAADNTFGLLQSTTVEDINKFITTKCMEAKEEWQGK